MKHLKYLKYVLVHKYYVMRECFKIGLYWRGLKHDISKFLPSEWFPYVEFFHGEKDWKLFDIAWKRHINRNDHHHQWWILNNDDGSKINLEMSKDATLEMLCDWYGAGKAQGKDGWNDAKKWYKEHHNHIHLNSKTREFVENFLEIK